MFMMFPTQMRQSCSKKPFLLRFLGEFWKLGNAPLPNEKRGGESDFVTLSSSSLLVILLCSCFRRSPKTFTRMVFLICLNKRNVTFCNVMSSRRYKFGCYCFSETEYAFIIFITSTARREHRKGRF